MSKAKKTQGKATEARNPIRPEDCHGRGGKRAGSGRKPKYGTLFKTLAQIGAAGEVKEVSVVMTIKGKGEKIEFCGDPSAISHDIIAIISANYVDRIDGTDPKIKRATIRSPGKGRSWISFEID